MIQITNKMDCCGCNACGDACSHNAISFQTDIEGFWYPVVNRKKCVDCGLCEKVCPELHIAELKKNDSPTSLHTIAAIHKRMDIRWDSTSGGAFSALADGTYEQGGYVSGAVYREDFSVRNFISNHPEDLARLRSSKYLQSNAEGLYREIRDLLRKGEKVLACGTPCQMAALRSFLRKDYDNLVIVDFICRGVNSPKVYRKYLDSLEKKYGGKVVYVKAKNKELGWRNLTRKVVFDNGQVYYGVRMDDDFRRGYHTNVFCRPSCYACKYKGFPRMADITIADYWGIEKVDKNLDNNIGTSLILLNSRKGEAYFERIKDKLEWKETAFESILPGNVALTAPIAPAQIDREAFFKDLNDIRRSFRRFAELLPMEGLLIINSDIPDYEEITEGLSCRVVTFGSSPDADYRAENTAYDTFGHPSFDLIRKIEKDGRRPRFSLKVPGEHNVCNALASIALADALRIPEAAVEKGLLSFTGTDRRFQYKGEVNGVTIIDDYAHHPTEIRATLHAAAHYPHRELWCVFQPHTYSRTKAFLKEFAEALSLADHVVLADIYAARETDTLGISSRDLERELAALGADVYYFPTFAEIEKFLSEKCMHGDMCITMGAGDVINIGEDLLK